MALSTTAGTAPSYRHVIFSSLRGKMWRLVDRRVFYIQLWIPCVYKRQLSNVTYYTFLSSMLRLFCNLENFYKFSLCNVIISQHPVFAVVSLCVFSWERVVCQTLSCQVVLFYSLQSTVLYSMSQSFTTEMVLFHQTISSSVISYRYPVYRLVRKVQNWRSGAISICI